MPSNYTPNYQLNQWDADDRVLRADFNADNAKIDAAIKAVDAKIPRIIFGSYTGDGSPSQDIVLGFQPRALLVFREDGCASFVSNRLHSCGGLVFPGGPVVNGADTALEITENGFRAYYRTDNDRYVFCNSKSTDFRYIAFV